MKTNAARQLDRLGIPYRTTSYVVDPGDLAAETVARKIGMPVQQVFKTLVCRLASGSHVFAVVPGDAEVDLKKLAAITGEKKAELAPLKEVEPLTGYIRGGVTAMAARREFPVFADETVELYAEISVSAGLRGLQLLLAPCDYLRAVSATVADLTKDTRQMLQARDILP